MSKYDIAAGASQSGLNSLVSQLYGKPAVRNNLFKGTVTKQIDVIGTVTVAYDLKTAPTFVLSPPTAAQWTASERRDPSITTAPPNTIQLVLSDLGGSASIAGSQPLPAEGPVTIYGIVKVANGTATIEVEALLIDEKSFSDWDKAIVNLILIPELFTLADSLIPGIPLPQLPSLGGLKFQPLAVGVQTSGIVTASTIEGGGTTDLTGFTWPLQPLFMLASLNAVNKFFASEVTGTYKEEDSKGPSGWTASGSVTASDLTVVAVINGTTVDLNISGSFSAYGELSGVGVGITKALLCPIGAAADAISDPSGWDKVVSSFDLKYSPNPMPVPVTFAAAAPSGNPLTQSITATVPSNELPSSIKLIVAPTWSGSVTGSALAAAAAAFVDLISAIFGKLIITDLVNKYGSKSFSLPSSEMTKTISLPEGVSVTLAVAAAVGPALQPMGTDQLLQHLQLTIT